MKSRGWMCRRVHQSIVCAHRNPPAAKKCQSCGKMRPARRKPAHARTLALSYESFIDLNGGVERCGICGAPPTPGRRLDRDHDHGPGGAPRGILCRACNRALVGTRFGLAITPEWLRAAADYLDRAAERTP